MIDLKRQAELRRNIELLYFAYRDFTSRPDQLLEKKGLNRTHHRIIYFVGRQPGVSDNELLRTLAVSKQALNAPLRQLIAMKLVAVKLDPKDGRVKRLELTQESRGLEARLSGTQMDRLEEGFSRFDPKMEKAWREIMTAIAGDAEGLNGVRSRK